MTQILGRGARHSQSFTSALRWVRARRPPGSGKTRYVRLHGFGDLIEGQPGEYEGGQ